MWMQVTDASASGDIPLAKSLLFNLWLGHMIIKIIELPVCTYESYAKSVFNRRIKDGVHAAMVKQDYEYFDKHSPGVLHARLDRDADELGENLLGFPKKMLTKFTWVVANLYLVYNDSPLPFFLASLAPVIVLTLVQYYSFQYFKKETERQRKISEEAIKETSEVLREIKTV